MNKDDLPARTTPYFAKYQRDVFVAGAESGSLPEFNTDPEAVEVGSSPPSGSFPSLVVLSRVRRSRDGNELDHLPGFPKCDPSEHKTLIITLPPVPSRALVPSANLAPRPVGQGQRDAEQRRMAVRELERRSQLDAPREPVRRAFSSPFLLHLGCG